jgi:hypothetical protein
MVNDGLPRVGVSQHGRHVIGDEPRFAIPVDNPNILSVEAERPL